jgi:hypothetical protein
MGIKRVAFVLSFLAGGYVALVGCGDDDATPAADAGADVAADTSGDTSQPDTSSSQGDARSPEYTGSACKVATDCYEDIDASSLKGEAVCIDKVQNGYCTHKCETDSDCCATPGECRTGLKQVCSPFTSTGEKYCFLSCEDDDISAATDAGASDAGADPEGYCHGNVSSDFGCRSTGGGSQNRKVCLPTGGGAGDGGTTDAGTDADASMDAPDDG